MMLYEIIKELKTAIKNKDEKNIKLYRRILNRHGMDDFTINMLLTNIK